MIIRKSFIYISFFFHKTPTYLKAGRWYQQIGAQVNLDQIDLENDDGEIRFSIWAAKKCAQAF